MGVTVVTQSAHGQIERRDGAHIHRRQRRKIYASTVSSNETLIPLWPPPKPPASRTPWIAAAVVGLLVAAVMAFLWVGARGDIDDRTLERDTAIAERDAVNATKIANDAELESLRNDMATAQEALDEAQSDTTETPSPEEVAEAQAAIDELNAEIERLTEENEELQGEVEAATTTTTTVTDTAPADDEQPVADADADADAAAATTADSTTTTSAPPDVAAEPADPDDVGDQVASLYRDDVLGERQKRCLGDFVLGNLGNAEAAEILSSENPGENEALEASLRLAVDFCLIAPSAVFGN